MARKKQNKCLVTEKDIVFSVIYERHQGYSAPGGKQTKAGMKKRARNAFEGMKFIKGFSPRLAEWVPITKCEDSPCFARIKYCFRCSISALKKFFFNTSMDFDANTMGILWDKDEHIDAYSFSSPLISDYVTAYDRDWFKRFGIRTDGMYEGQNLSSENAYVGVSIPEARLVEAIEHTFGKKLEDIKEKRILNNIQINMDKLVQSYTLVLNWVRDLSEDSYSFEEPIPHFEIDFREQDLFAQPMDARVYDGGKQYDGGDRYTVYLKMPNYKKRNCKILSSDKRVKGYNGLWISAQPLGNDGVSVNTQEWLESGKNVMGFGKKIDLSTMPQYYQDWVKKVDKFWLAAWRVDTEEAWNKFYKSIC